MGKTSMKQVLRVVTTLIDNLPEEIEDLDSKVAQRIIDGRRASGREFMRFLKNGACVQIGNHIIDCSADPFVPKGWKVEEHQRAFDFVWNPNVVRLHSSNSQKGGKDVEGTKLREELKDRPVLNANVLDYLLAHSELIPKEWRGMPIFFWGTIYRDSGGDLCVRCLTWNGYLWGYSCFWLHFFWSSSHLAAVSARGLIEPLDP